MVEGVGERSDGGGTVRGGHTRGGAGLEIDGDGERGAVRIVPVGHHQGKVEGVGSLIGQGDADDAGGVADHEGERFGRGQLGRHDEVAFVLAVGVVGDQHHPARRQLGEGVGHGVAVTDWLVG